MTDRLEQALVEQLAAEGLISRRQWRPLGSVVLCVALAAAFWLGLAWHSLKPDAESGGQKYVLLLYEGPDFQRVPGGHGAEYAAWARASHPDGRVIDGEELDAALASLGPSAGSAAQPAGFFIIEASDAAAALRLARTCPHLRHGGSIQIRPAGN